MCAVVGASVREKARAIRLATDFVQTRSALLASPVEDQHPILVVVGGADGSVAVVRAIARASARRSLEPEAALGAHALSRLPLREPVPLALEEPLREPLQASVEGPSGLEAQ